MDDLEKTYHNGVEIDKNICMKHDLGNRIVINMRWSTKPPGRKHN